MVHEVTPKKKAIPNVHVCMVTIDTVWESCVYIAQNWKEHMPYMYISIRWMYVMYVGSGELHR